MSSKTSFEKVYDRFLSKVTDDMYISMSVEDVKDDLKTIMQSAISYFPFPKQPIKMEGGSFTEDLDPIEIEIISELMVGEWINRQIRTVRLTELQVTGNDAKGLNTGGQMRALKEIKHKHDVEVSSLIHFYHYGERDEDGRTTPLFNLSGKKR